MHAADLRVVGTDLLGVEFSKALYAFAGGADIQLALAFDGSRPGLEELKAGRANLGLIVFAPGEEAGATMFERLPLAYHRAVILVPANCPLDQLTLEQLDGVFGVGGPLVLTRWGQLGVVDPAWSSSEIAPHAPAVGTGLIVEYFRHAALGHRAIRADVRRYDAPAELSPRLIGESRAIALAAAAPGGANRPKLVAISLRAGEPAFLPTQENVHSGDYPLRLPLSLVFRRESAAALRPLLRFLLSDSAVVLFERASLAPLPESARRQQVLALEKM